MTFILAEYIPWMSSNTGGFARGKGGSRGVVHDAKTGVKTFPGIANAMISQWGLIYQRLRKRFNENL